MSLPKEIWDPQIPLGNYQLSHCNCRNKKNHTWRCNSNHITKLVHFHSPRLDHISTKPNPGHPPKFGFPNFHQQPSSTSQRKITAGGSLGYQPVGGSFGAINGGHRGVHLKQIRFEEDWCMYVVENYWVHGKCSKFFLGSGGNYDGIGISGFQWIRNWFSDETSCSFPYSFDLYTEHDERRQHKPTGHSWPHHRFLKILGLSWKKKTNTS